ncbi:MAG: hypothetical protein A2096_14625 [Spirochaetes bacterium GWF1_41_5]|nr:MAG: hypothetical protein A2096_14625 [Spirochaetes bacterium GWF1_41_5]HBE04737.1 hypothetical protein [Spirochaetia bacterium]
MIFILLLISELLFCRYENSSMQVLTVNPCARSAGMADISFPAGSAEALFHNPAFLADKYFSLFAGYRYILGEANYGAVSSKFPAGPGSAAAGGAWLANGPVDIYESGVLTGKISPYQFSAGGAYACNLRGILMIGAGVFFLYSKLTDQYKGAGFAVNGGLVLADPLRFLKKSWTKNLQIGAVIKNAGIGPQTGTKRTELPSRIITGICYTVHADKPEMDFSAAAEIIPWSKTGRSVHTAVEAIFIFAPGILSAGLRAGLTAGKTRDTFKDMFRCGLGITLRSMSLDYAIEMNRAGYFHNISISLIRPSVKTGNKP